MSEKQNTDGQVTESADQPQALTPAEGRAEPRGRSGTAWSRFHATMDRAVRYHDVGSTLLAPLRSDRESGSDRERMRGMQTDALELEQRADRIVLKYSVVGGAWNL